MTYAMTLDNSWEMMSEDEMYDVNGGLSIWAKAAISAAIVAAGAGLIVALAYGQIYLAAKIMGLTFKAFVSNHGAAAVITFVATATGVSVGLVATAITLVMQL